MLLLLVCVPEADFAGFSGRGVFVKVASSGGDADFLLLSVCVPEADFAVFTGGGVWVEVAVWRG